MTPTEYKLAEASYFLNQLKVSDPFFDFILSAYLNAARSVSWVMRHEFESKNGWSDWFKTSEVSDREAQLLAEMNRLRIQATKQDGITTEHYVFPGVVVDQSSYGDLKQFFQAIPEGSEVMIRIAASEEATAAAPTCDDEDYDTWRFRARVSPDVDLEEDPERRRFLEMSQQYYAFLERKVLECVARFG
ncbi:MAG TPA: hypothetical protein VM032_06710 [Vicinamibacterales bacterium]|nr:hypothetical protein [Vicinamibacterales bacterium]